MAVKNGVFTSYSGVGGDVVIPNGVTSIGVRAFKNRQKVTSVVIPEGVTSIGDYAFYFCTKLKRVTIPKSVTSIGRGAFDFCWELKSVTVPANATIADNAFPKDCKVTRAGSVRHSSATRATSSSAPKITAPKSASGSATRTSSTPRAASSSVPARASSTAKTGNDFLSQVRKNSDENSPENILRRRAEAEAQKNKEKRMAEKNAAWNAILTMANKVKEEILHYSPYYWHSTGNGQRECTGEIVFEGVWSYDIVRGTGKYQYHCYGVDASVNWYGNPRMNKNEIPPINRQYQQPKSWQERVARADSQETQNSLMSPVFFPDFVKSYKGFFSYKTVYTVNGESLGEKMLLEKLKEVLGAGVSIFPCVAEIHEDKRSAWDKYDDHYYSYNAIVLTRKYKFKFVF